MSAHDTAARITAAVDALGTGPLAEESLLRHVAPLFARVRECDAPPVGSEVGVAIDAGGVLVFEAGNNNGGNGAS